MSFEEFIREFEERRDIVFSFGIMVILTHFFLTKKYFWLEIAVGSIQNYLNYSFNGSNVVK